MKKRYLVGLLLVLSNLASYAQLQVGTTVALKASNGSYVSSENGARPMNANRGAVAAWERFEVGNGGGGTITLKGNNGLYVSSENGNQNGVNCNRPVVGAWERFTVVNGGGGSFSLRSSQGRYLSSENGTRTMRCDRQSVGQTEMFTAEVQGGGGNNNGGGGNTGISLAAEVNAAGGNVVTGLNNALNNAGAGGTVNVDGTFVLNGRVVITQANITINGNGSGVLRRNNNGNQNIFTIGNTSGVKLRGLTLEGPGNINNITGFSALVNLNGSENFSAVNTNFKRATLGIFARFKPTNGFNVDGCVFEDCLQFGYLFVRDVVRIDSSNKVMAALNGGSHRITNCTFQGNYQDGFSWDAGNDGSFTQASFPEQNSPLRALVTERQTRLLGANNARSVFYGNNVINSRRFGISTALVDGLNIGGWSVGQPNSFSMAQASAGSYAHSVHLEHTTINVDVINNAINSRDNDAIVLEPFTDHGAVRGPAEGTRDIRILGNRFVANNNSASASGVFANNHHRTTIQNNFFTGFRAGRLYRAFQAPSDALLSVSGNSPAIQ